MQFKIINMVATNQLSIIIFYFSQCKMLLIPESLFIVYSQTSLFEYKKSVKEYESGFSENQSVLTNSIF
jgi:hypothetical protein